MWKCVEGIITLSLDMFQYGIKMEEKKALISCLLLSTCLFSPLPCEGGIIVTIVQVGKLRLREGLPKATLLKSGRVINFPILYPPQD